MRTERKPAVTYRWRVRLTVRRVVDLHRTESMMCPRLAW